MEEKDLEKRLAELRAEKEKIEAQITAISQEQFKKYRATKELVTHDNPYSRLYALKKMGVVPNYEEFSTKSAVIIGVGGVGSVLAEMLTRMGIGKLILYDYDKVELANMNRLFYTPAQVGLTKVEAAKRTLQSIVPEVEIEGYCDNITTPENFEILVDRLQSGGLKGSKIDILFCCVDNYAARMSVSGACNRANTLWLESGVSEDALSCHIQLMVPGETACFACLPPLAFLDKNEGKVKREGVCAASLPTTMAMTAALLAHTGLKLLLAFEDVACYIGYNSRREFFEKSKLLASPECLDSFCRQRQKEVTENKNCFLEEREKIIEEKRKAAKPKPRDPELDQYEFELVEDSETKQCDKTVKDSELQELSVDELAKALQNL